MQRTNHSGMALSADSTRRALRALGLLLFACVFGVSAASCGDSTTRAQLSKGRAINSDCDSPLVCAFQTCHKQCDSSRDCPDSQLCVTSERPHSVCQFPSEASCAYNSQCVAGEVCARDGRCREIGRAHV